MAQALRSEQPEQAFAVDLTNICRLAAERAHEYASSKTSPGKSSPEPLANREGACDYFTYGWLKAVSEELAALEWPVASAHLLPPNEDGDSMIVDVVLVAENGTAALQLICSSLEAHYGRAARQEGFASTMKVHILPAKDAQRSHALSGGLYNPALQFWP